MPDPFSLSERTAFVTGACGGIGAATARLFARARARLILTSDRPERCAALAGELRQAGASVETLAADLADMDAVGDLARRAWELAGGIDVLVCNAGIEGHVGPIGKATPDAIEAVLAVNLKSAMALTASIAPQMAAAGKGSIILVSSIAGLRGNRAIGLYGVSKAALAQLGRNLAVEFGPEGVRANTISPGLIRTPFADPILKDAGYLERRLSLTPLRRPGTPEEIAASILYLASDASGFVTGHNLVVDGGTMISDGN